MPIISPIKYDGLDHLWVDSLFPKLKSIIPTEKKPHIFPAFSKIKSHKSIFRLISTSTMIIFRVFFSSPHLGESPGLFHRAPAVGRQHELGPRVAGVGRGLGDAGPGARDARGVRHQLRLGDPLETWPCHGDGHGFHNGKPQENHRKTTGKAWETTGKAWENHRKTMGKPSKTIGQW